MPDLAPLMHLNDIPNELTDDEREEICLRARKATATYANALKMACVDAGILIDNAELTRFAANVFATSIQGQAARLVQRQTTLQLEEAYRVASRS